MNQDGGELGNGGEEFDPKDDKTIHCIMQSDLVGWYGRCTCGWDFEFERDWKKHLAMHGKLMPGPHDRLDQLFERMRKMGPRDNWECWKLVFEELRHLRSEIARLRGEQYEREHEE